MGERKAHNSGIIDQFIRLRYILKRRMGSVESSNDQPANQTQLKCVETASVPKSIEYPLGDPLRTFLKQKTNLNEKVKTLSDVQRGADQLKLKQSALSASGIHRQPPAAKEASVEQPNHAEIASPPTHPNPHAKKQNTQPNSPALEASNPKPQFQRIDSKNRFKNRVINTEKFIKIREQSPSAYYEFKEMIGEGSYGQVFRAVCRRTGEVRAIKVLKGRLMREGEVRGLLGEVTLQSSLNHPSIVSLCDLFHHQQLYYVVMEYCSGGSVVDMINKIPLKSELIIANILKQLLRALSYLHSLNIVHRDVKLENLVFLNDVDATNDYIPIKIIDFGAAVKSQYRVVQNYPVAGTLSYLAPEAMKGVLTDKSDLWSSGVLMYILLTGVSPFRGRSEAETVQNINTKELNFRAAPLVSLSAEARDLLQKLLERNMYRRISANDALSHPWFSKLATQEISKASLDKLESYEVTTILMQRGNNLVSVIESYLALKKVTQQERQNLAQMFTDIDRDGNGLIEKEELLGILRRHAEDGLGGGLGEQGLEELVGSIDKNSSGQIDFNEFIIAMSDKDKLYVRDSLNEAFEYFDRDHTGFIEMEELRGILHGGDAAELEYFILKIDQDRDHRISREEFISYLLAY